ncbi:hypothetical protein ALC56_01488 [Trachymyrmex septentrionalis]|uniref:Uncharacterized protein n=1 Tax=Trachymyrmex septentrionalis TaxID=34720 RepID=A0A195FTK5_9HYME|nr:hypothetical protein ALC56_01488 [Trachymyrmex septentrionalis]
MISHRTRKRKGTIFSNSFKQKNINAYGTMNYSKNRLHDHPYETRSKRNLREIEMTDLIKSLIPSKRLSESSVIYLGSFHKSPQLITLEDSKDSFPEKVIQRNVNQYQNEKSFKVIHIFYLL